ncbi:MAG: hypothetical protein HGB03_01900 [Candidatus Yonathbacteria bacterium]|nr:hypothetical protein [Candidatus Yonathbacteria bacterium]NTW48012.1 hypothetical protein [Candidatus Yonathbacteria bacterium]
MKRILSGTPEFHRKKASDFVGYCQRTDEEAARMKKAKFIASFGLEFGPISSVYEKHGEFIVKMCEIGMFMDIPLGLYVVIPEDETLCSEVHVYFLEKDFDISEREDDSAGRILTVIFTQNGLDFRLGDRYWGTPGMCYNIRDTPDQFKVNLRTWMNYLVQKGIGA